MNDLLGNVRGGGEENGFEADDIEAGYQPPPSDGEQSMQSFFRYVEDIKTDVAEIRSLQREINSMHEKSKTLVKSKDMQKHRDDMQVRAWCDSGRQGWHWLSAHGDGWGTLRVATCHLTCCTVE